MGEWGVGVDGEWEMSGRWGMGHAASLACSPSSLQVVMSTSSTCEYEYSWENPKWKLVLNLYLFMQVPVWDTSTQVQV